MSSIENEKTYCFCLHVWHLDDICNDFEWFIISTLSQGLVHNYYHDEVKYVIKFRLSALKLEQEIAFIKAMGSLSVNIVDRIYDRQNSLIEFTISHLRVIKSSELTFIEKLQIFSQIRQVILDLYKCQIIYENIKLSNILLNRIKLKLCDFETSTWISKIMISKTYSFQWCSIYRLSNDDRNSLIDNEDFYANEIIVWELFVEEVSFEDIDSNDEEMNLEKQIGFELHVDVERIEIDEARLYMTKCLYIFNCFDQWIFIREWLNAKYSEVNTLTMRYS